MYEFWGEGKPSDAGDLSHIFCEFFEGQKKDQYKLCRNL